MNDQHILTLPPGTAAREDGVAPVQPTCYACGRELDSLRVTWAHRDGILRPMHRACVHPTPRVHGVVIR